jgi:hypothetical protein
MKPIIIEEDGRLYLTCPFCRGRNLYSISCGPFAEVACGTAFGLHLYSCEKRPLKCKKEEIDQLLSEIFGDGRESD